VPKVAHGQPRACFVPAPHGVFAAHGLPGIVKRTAGVERRPALRRDDARDGRQRADAAVARSTQPTPMPSRPSGARSASAMACARASLALTRCTLRQRSALSMAASASASRYRRCPA